MIRIHLSPSNDKLEAPPSTSISTQVASLESRGPSFIVISLGDSGSQPLYTIHNFPETQDIKWDLHPPLRIVKTAKSHLNTRSSSSHQIQINHPTPLHPPKTSVLFSKLKNRMYQTGLLHSLTSFASTSAICQIQQDWLPPFALPHKDYNKLKYALYASQPVIPIAISTAAQVIITGTTASPN